MDLAVDQLEQLIGLPAEPPKHVAHWLNLLATLQIRRGRDLEAARTALLRIIEKFPGAALAAVAETRLNSLKMELKGGEKTSLKPLGAYEKSIGLKPSS
jgi:hypothetical protein